MKTHQYFLTLLLIVSTWPVASTALAASPGTVVGWGEDFYGQTTVPVAAQSGVTAIAAGSSYTVALKSDGSVVAWGSFDGTYVPVAAQSGVTAIAAGYAHAAALKNDGSVVAWGENFYGATTVPAAAQTGMTAVAAGASHTVALKNDGTVVAWGYNDYGQTTVPEGLTGVTAIAAGGYHTVALIGITPGQAVSQLLRLLDQANLGTKNKQPLIATLGAAMAAIDRGNFNAALNQLSAFQNKVHAQVAPLNVPLANQLTAASQKIIQALSASN